MKQYRTPRHRRSMAATALTALLTLAMILAMSPSFAGSTFQDISSGDWYYTFVSDLAGEGIISGYPDGTFRPGNQVTVGQFLAMAIQTGEQMGALKETEVETSGSSTSKTHWARPFYDQALEGEILFRDELPPTSLDQPIPRLWMAVITSRLLPKDIEVGDGGSTNLDDAYDNALDAITDIEPLYPYSHEIVTAYTQGLLSGYPDGSFRPDGYLTRAEAATVIYKLRDIWEENRTSAIDDEVEIPMDSDLSPSYGYDPAPSDMAEGTILFWYQLPAETGSEDSVSELTETLRKEMEPVLREICQLMNRHTESLFTASSSSSTGAEELYKSFEAFLMRAVPHQLQGKQGLRKEYIEGYPILMEAISGEIRVYVKPKGSETRFWGIEPGEIYEEFF